MRNYALRNGVPDSVIRVDDQGLRTYESCYRATSIFDETELIVISQREHLARAMYICQRMHIITHGFTAAEFSGLGEVTYEWREHAAWMLAWLDVNFFHPRP